jgi:hypothetical protein
VVAREFGAQQVGLVLLSGAAQLESQLELSSTGDAEFAFEALAAGVYELMASVYSSENDVQLIQLRSVSAPTSDVLLHFNSQEARLAIQLRARDAQSGDDIFANVHVTPQCSVVDFSLEVSASSAQPHYQFLPIDGADATWRVECRGYAPAWGPLSELNFVQGLAVLDVELTPGWGVLLEVFGPDATPRRKSRCSPTANVSPPRMRSAERASRSPRSPRGSSCAARVGAPNSPARRRSRPRSTTAERCACG